MLLNPVSTIHLQIGGTEEYKICQGIKEGRITKPVVCWCIGTCATMFASEVSRLPCGTEAFNCQRGQNWTCRLSFRSSLDTPAPVLTRLQRRRWPRTKPSETLARTYPRALTSWGTSSGEAWVSVPLLSGRSEGICLLMLSDVLGQDCLRGACGQWHHRSCPGGASPNRSHGLFLGQGTWCRSKENVRALNPILNPDRFPVGAGSDPEASFIHDQHL